MACRIYKWTEDKREKVISALRASATRADAAKLLGVTVSALDHACQTYGVSKYATLGQDKRDVVEIQRPPDTDLPIGELLEHRKRRFALKAANVEASKLIPVRVKENLPIGLLVFGDPHLDDDGSDLSAVESHARLVRETPGLYGCTPGDMSNNWVGRLAHLWSEQSTSASDSWRLCEWFVGEVRDWLFLIGGNHDAWSGQGDPLKWITGQHQALYQSSEVRLELRFPGGAKFRVNARHDFAGHSQWNPAHGPSKALMMGVRDDLALAGHLHISALSVLKDPDSGRIMHAVRVASYKRHDRYAIEKGLRDQAISPCALITVDPTRPETHPDRTHVWWDPEAGAEFLTWARKRARA